MKNDKPARKHSNVLVKQLLDETSEIEKAKIRNRMTLAARLDDLITSRGWNKSEFAAKVGKSPSEITKWLSGNQNFTVDTLTEISDAFNLPVAELFAAPKPQIIDHVHFLVRSTKPASSPLNEFVGKKSANLPSADLKSDHPTMEFSFSTFKNAQS